jgi:nephrocystin-3
MRENYPDPKALGELVLTDLTKVINDLFPEGSQPDPLDREAMDHEAYAQSRERVYIGRQEYFDRLDAHAAGNDTQPLVVLGESGSGKSALLANWVAHYRQAHPDAVVIQHYTGATPYSADWAAMLRRFMGEFKRRLGIHQDIPDQPDALRSAFQNGFTWPPPKAASCLCSTP